MKSALTLISTITLLASAVSCNLTPGGVNRPKPEFVGSSAREANEGSEYTIWVECKVRNNGDGGEIDIVAQLRNGGAWERRQTVSLAEGAEETLVFEFKEATVLESGVGGYSYTCSS